MVLAVASAFVIPAIERWGVLVTNLGVTVVLMLGALYVFDIHLLLSSSRRPEYAGVRVSGRGRWTY